MFQPGYHRREIVKTAARFALGIVLFLICIVAIVAVLFFLGKVLPDGSAWKGMEAPVMVQRIDTHGYNTYVPAWWE